VSGISGVGTHPSVSPRKNYRFSDVAHECAPVNFELLVMNQDDEVNSLTHQKYIFAGSKIIFGSGDWTFIIVFFFYVHNVIYKIIFQLRLI